MPINMPMEFDEFKRLVQYIPALIIKPQFNERNVSENVSVEHGVTVVRDEERVRLSSISPGATLADLAETYLNPGITSNIREAFHIHFQAQPGNGYAGFKHVITASTDFRVHIGVLSPARTYRDGRITARIPSENRERRVIGDERMYDCLHRVHERIRWYLHWKMVPFFVGVDCDTCQTIRKIPDPMMLAGWLEDYADATFDSIKAEAYLTGAELLKNAHT